VGNRGDGVKADVGANCGLGAAESHRHDAGSARGTGRGAAGADKARKNGTRTDGTGVAGVASLRA
jgi:hypothetical protein